MICGPAKDQCRKLAQDDAFILNVQYDKCNCLPSCSELRYNAYASQADFELIKTFSKMDHRPDYDINKYAKTVHFFQI